MEVHAHPQTPRKKWIHYFWEFLMLFLAVFCGFLAEYQLEHVIEKQREKEYIKSFIEDLKLDTTTITDNIHWKQNKIKQYDTLIHYLNEEDPNQHGRTIYFYARQLIRTRNFFSADRTVKQLKNSGGLRLIKSVPASDSIMAYDVSVERIYLNQVRQEDEINVLRTITGKVLDANILETMIAGEEIYPPAGNPPLRNTDRELLHDFIYDIHQYKSSDVVNTSALLKLKGKATGIIQFLQNEYHLK
ncbi:MAG TPA: hypothetical protein VJ765_10945 [Chitinophagaceae bacterium]|nr:hypothetical protein [Chitinophagaceae bacterium]